VKQLDLLGRRFLLACLGLFLVAFALKLNGSSSFVWRELLNDKADGGGLVLGQPRFSRSDEWLAWTPALLWQCEHGFPSENPSLGAGKAPFLYSLPVRNYTMWARPQLYGFFLFGAEWGYAWYWNVKIFGLLTTVYLLFWTLTKDSKLSIFGTLWVFFSNYIQWWFSCPPMLPEMLSSWAGALVCAVSILEKRSWWARLLLGGAFILCWLNFLLCLYPPFQIPLLYLGVALFATYLWTQRESGEPSTWQGAVFLASACICTVVLLVPFFFELKPTLELLSSTSYPGHRRSGGGSLPFIQYFSGLMNLLDSSLALPKNFSQINETANFFPLWLPVALVTGRALIAEPRKYSIQIASLAVVIFLSAYALCPLPSWITNPTLLSFCTEVRALLTIGLANVFFVVLSFPLFQRCLAQWNPKAVVATIGLLGLFTWLYLQNAKVAYPIFLTPWRLWIFLVLDVTLLALLLKARARIFALCFIAILVVTDGRVNPVMTGLGSILRATPAAAIQKIIRDHPNDAWVAYESNQLSEFLMALGANVASGLKIVPDLDFYRAIDPTGESSSIYNRYSFGFFLFRKDRATAGLRPYTFPSHLVSIHPLNVGMKARHVRFFVFSKPLGEPAAEGVELVLSFPNNHIWVYQAATTPDRVALIRSSDGTGDRIHLFSPWPWQPGRNQKCRQG
jgi:hypothetical protein